MKTNEKLKLRLVVGSKRRVVEEEEEEGPSLNGSQGCRAKNQR